jgi:hypothetical protein
MASLSPTSMSLLVLLLCLYIFHCFRCCCCCCCCCCCTPPCPLLPLTDPAVPVVPSAGLKASQLQDEQQLTMLLLPLSLLLLHIVISLLLPYRSCSTTSCPPLPSRLPSCKMDSS